MTLTAFKRESELMGLSGSGEMAEGRLKGNERREKQGG